MSQAANFGRDGGDEQSCVDGKELLLLKYVINFGKKSSVVANASSKV